MLNLQSLNVNVQMLRTRDKVINQFSMPCMLIDLQIHGTISELFSRC